MDIKALIANLQANIACRYEAAVRRHPRLMRHPRAIALSAQEIFMGDLLIYGGYAAYTIILALFPFVIFLLALASVIGTPTLAQDVINYSFEVFPKELADILAPVIREIMANNDEGILTLAVLGTLWIASSGVEGIRYGLNIMYGVTEERTIWYRRLQGIGFVALVAVGFLVLATLLIVWPIMAKWLGDNLSFLRSYGLNFLRYVLSFGILVSGLSFVYRFLPYGKRSIRHVWQGAIAATVLWLIITSLFTLYLVNIEEYALRYGSFAGGILTLVFLQFTAVAILFGGKYNVVLQGIRERDKKK